MTELADVIYRGALIAGAFTAASFGYKKFAEKTPTALPQAGLVVAAAFTVNKLIEKNIISAKLPKKIS